MARARRIGGIEIDVNLGVANVEKSVNKLNADLTAKFDNMSRNIARAFTLTAAVGGLYALKRGIDSLIGTASQLANIGETAGSIQTQFENLGGTASSIDKAKTAVLGMVDSYDLMRLANQNLVAKIPEANKNFEMIATFGSRLAETMGVDAVQGIQKVNEALKGASVRQLSQLGILIDTESAYRAYSEQLGVNLKMLTDADKMEARRIAVLEEMAIRVDELAALEDSLANSMSAVNTAIDEGVKRIAIQVNESEDLTRAFRDLANALDDVDWNYLGQVVAGAFEKIMIAAQNALPHIENFARGLDVLFTLSPTAQIYEAQQKVTELSAKLEQYDADINRVAGSNKNFWDRVSGDALTGAAKAKMHYDEVQEELLAWQIKLDELTARPDEESQREKEELEEKFKIWQEQKAAEIEHQKELQRLEREAARERDKLSEESKRKAKQEAEAARKELEKLAETWQKTIADMDQSVIKNEIQDSLDNVDYSAFLSGIDRLGAHIERELSADINIAVEKGLIDRATADRYLAFMKSQVIEPYADAWKDKQEEIATETVDFWRSAFENMITGEMFNLEDALKRIAVGFGAQIAASIIGGINGGIGSLEDLGGLIAKQLLVGGQGGLLGAIVPSLGLGDMLQTGAAGLAGYLGIGGISAGAGAVGAGAGAGAFGAGLGGGGFGAGVGATTATSGLTLASVAGPAAIAAAAYMVVDKMGVFDHEPHPETQARWDFDKWLQDRLKAAGGLWMFGEGNQYQNAGSRFDMHSDEYKKPGWADKLNAGPYGGTFTAMGEGLEELAGLTEDIGGQIGFALQENLLGNLDNARLLLKTLGVSVEELGEALFDAAKRGEISWQAFEVHMQNLVELNGEGLVGVGDLEGALAQMSATGGIGMQALVAVQNLAIEAMELGITTVDELGAKVVEAGLMSAEQWAEFSNILQQRGVSSMEELANAEERVLGGIVADLDSNIQLFEEWKDQAHDVADEVSGIGDAWGDVPETKKTKYTIEVDKTGDESPFAESALGGVFAAINRANSASLTSAGSAKMRKLAMGGIVTGPTLAHTPMGMALIGEAGPEAVMPLRRSASGELGVIATGGGGGVINFNIDARGGTPGIERRILAAVSQQAKITARATLRSMRRGR